jgi:HEPN domain-containing protein
VAERDLGAARSNLRAGDFDWALAIAYNSMLLFI